MTQKVDKPKLERIALVKAVLQGYRARLDEELLPLGISTAQLRLLWTVERHPEASGAEVARLCSVTPQTGQASMARMEANGWLRRRTSEASERVLVAEVTAKGRKILQAAREIAVALDGELWAGFSKSELAAMDGALSKVVGKLERR